LCRKHFDFLTWQCKLCNRIIATPPIEGGELGFESTDPNNFWCSDCCAEKNVAHCEACHGLFCAEHLTSEPTGLFCNPCRYRRRKIGEGGALLVNADWKAVVEEAIRTLPRELQEVVEVDQCWGDQIDLILDCSSSEDRADEEVREVSIRQVHGAAGETWPFGPPASHRYPFELVVQKTVWWMLSITATTAGVSFLHAELAYDVDLEQAVLELLLGEMANAGMVRRDKFSRFINEDSHRILPWQ
jgi:hypothetical protein